MLSNKFLRKVAGQSFVDTRKYRYISHQRLSYVAISRCLKSDLDTVGALYDNHEFIASVAHCNGAVTRF
jgi:hypothetical protein